MLATMMSRSRRGDGCSAIPRKLGLRGVEFGRTATADGRPLDPREIRKSEEAPLDVIRRALRASAAEGDQAFLRWYGQRAGQ